MTYEQAVELAKRKEEAGYQFLYESTYREKYYIALKYMKNEEDALDILQDAYMKAFDKLDTLYEAEKFPAWLGMIVANTAKNALAKKKPILFSEMNIENEDEDAFDYQTEDENIENQPELSYTREETRELVRQLIGALSEEQRLCILMFHIEDMSIREIAEILDCSENTVKSRLNYGRKNLKTKAEELEKKGYKLYGIAPLMLLLYLLRVEGAAFQPEAGMEERLSYQKFMDYFHKHSQLSNTASSGEAGLADQAANAAGKAVKQAFLYTMAGKVTVTIIAVVIAAGVIAAVRKSQSKSLKSSSIVITGISEEDLQAALDADESDTEEQMPEEQMIEEQTTEEKMTEKQTTEEKTIEHEEADGNIPMSGTDYISDEDRTYVLSEIEPVKEIANEDGNFESETQDWKSAYITVVNDPASWLKTTQNVSASLLDRLSNYQYSIYDINQDGIPELIISESFVITS